MKASKIEIGNIIMVGGVPAKVTDLATDGVSYVMENGNTGFMPYNYFE